MTNLRTLLWVYLWLLILEGSIRKWIVPQLDTPLLVVRDPLVIWIYIVALQQRLSFNSAFFIPNLILAICTAITATIFGYGNPLVTAYGLRTDFLQIPLIFLMPQILNRDDVIAMGRFILYLSIPTAVLVIIQFRSPIDALVNKGAFVTHFGTVRPSGPFSFIAGLVSYYALVASFLFYGYLERRAYKIWLIVVVTFTLLLSSACSGSRSCLFSVAIVAAVAVLCVVMRGKGGVGLMIAAVVIALLVPVLSSFSIFQQGTEQLQGRFAEGAANGEDAGGLVGRFAGTMAGPLSELGDVMLFGHGLGLGTNVGATLAWHTTGTFYGGSEEEWGRLIYECGSIFGFLLVLFRIALAVAIGRAAYFAVRDGNLLPILIYAGCGLNLLNGQWGVPTTLGFAMFGGGLVLAACEVPEDEEEEYEEDEAHDESDDASDHPTATDAAN
jgi:hypothetical protein